MLLDGPKNSLKTILVHGEQFAAALRANSDAKGPLLFVEERKLSKVITSVELSNIYKSFLVSDTLKLQTFWRMFS